MSKTNKTCAPSKDSDQPGHPRSLGSYSNQEIKESQNQVNKVPDFIFILELSPQYYDCDEISKEGFSNFGDLLKEHDHAGDFLVDELMEIVHDGDK